jgi:DNA-binding NarL/FixJ family response regulator
MTTEKINLALVDDHRVFRKALSSYLSHYSDINISIEAANGSELLQALETTPCNVVLLDLHTSVSKGIETIKILQQAYPDIKVLVLSVEADLTLTSNLLELGIHGYLCKSDEPENLYEAVRAVHTDRMYRNRLFTEALYFAKYNSLSAQNKARKKVDFDSREINILQLLWEEKGNKEIASAIFIGIRSVERIRQDMKRKLGVTTTVGLIKYALENQLIVMEQNPLYSCVN